MLEQMSVMDEVSQLNWGAFKPKVADAIIAHLDPIQARYKEVMADPAILDKVSNLHGISDPQNQET